VTLLGGPPITAAELLDLEETGPGRFRAWNHQRNHTAALYGGQIVAQALRAAMRMVENRPAHSLHAYFLRGGVIDAPIDYAVDTLRDGRRFAMLLVTASQAGRALFHMHCSLHDAEPGFDHQLAMPGDVPAPETLPSLADYVAANTDRLNEAVIQSYGRPFPLEVRPCDAETIFFGRLVSPHRDFWIRMPSAAAMRDQRAQQCLLAFLSDYWLAGVAAGQHRSSLTADGFVILSLDHALWFHRPADAGDWLLYRTDSPSARAGRGLSRGLIYDRAGRLIASTAQEAVMRRP
jgi:acyl-CoA thioesterase-2